MKKLMTPAAETDDTLRAEYDFSDGVRGKHYRVLQGGYTIIIRNADGTSQVKEVKPSQGAVILEPDVRKYFPDSESVNTALRSLIRLIPNRQRLGAKNQRARQP